MPAPINVLICNAKEDEPFREQLETHLAMLRRTGEIRTLHRTQVRAGRDRRAATNAQIENAQIILLLISSSFLSSDYHYAVEATKSIERHRTGMARVIPILVRACDLSGALFDDLQVLPRSGRPVMLWEDGDQAWMEVARGIRGAIEELPHDTTSPTAKFLLPAPPHDPRVDFRLSYPDLATKRLSEQIEAATRRRNELRNSGFDTRGVDEEIRDLRRQIREGGRLRAGDSLGDGRYLLFENLGQGGFAFVWKAYDREQRRTVAVKVLHSNLAGGQLRRERFFRGARVMAELEHDAVVRVFDPYGEDGGYYYYIMEFVDGCDLRRAVLEKKIDLRRSIDVILKIGEALSEGHAKGILHRDVKPANILLDERNNPKLTDFDLVAAFDTSGGTRTGAAMGTAFYAAPELIHHPHDADVRADVFGLGMTTMFCIYGDDLPASVMWSRAELIEKLPQPRRVKDVLDRATAPEPERRFDDVDTFCRVLAAAFQSDVVRPPRKASTRDRLAFLRSTCDDLFENNRRRIKKTETMVHALYREWFVHFRHPDHVTANLVNSEHGKAPDGWSWVQLGEIVDEVRKRIQPSVLGPDYPYVGLEHLTRRSFALESWGVAGEVTSSKLFASRGDILFSKVRPDLHKVCVAPLDAVCSSELVVLRVKDLSCFGFVLAYLTDDDFIGYASARSWGMTIPRIGWGPLKKRWIPLPPHSLLATFEEIATAAVELIFALIHQNHILQRMYGSLNVGPDGGSLDALDLTLFEEGTA